MSEVNWPTVGVCWALTTVTTVVLYVVSKVVIRILRKRGRNCKPTKERIWSTSDNKHDGRVSGQDIPLMTEVNSPSKPNGSSNLSSSISSRPNSHPTDRRPRDDVTHWCSDHGLPETLVYTLREQGFVTKAVLDALRPEDLEGNPAALQLPNKAIKVLLRDVLTKQQDNRQRNPSTNGNPRQQGTRKRPDLAQSLSDSGITSDTHSPTYSSDVFPPVLSSIDEVDGRCNRNEPGKKTSTSRGTSNPRTKPTDVKSQPRFNGLLSDKGLWQIADKMGHDWCHLAALLGISKQTQEQLLENNPRKVKNAIYEMLVMWRNEAKGNKEQIKGRLYKALVDVERGDIAKLIMDEEMNGSGNNIHNYTSII